MISNIGVDKVVTDDLYDKLHPEDPGIQQLAESIQENGLLHPIVINEKNEIVCGRKRLFVFKEILRRSKIPFTTKDVYGDDKEFCMIDENICRSAPDDIEMAGLLKRRKELIAKKHPEYFKPGPKDVASFAGIKSRSEIAEETGISERTQREYEFIGEHLNDDPRVIEVFRRHKLNKGELYGLTHTSKETQRRVAEALEDIDRQDRLRRLIARAAYDVKGTLPLIIREVEGPTLKTEFDTLREKAADAEVIGKDDIPRYRRSYVEGGVLPKALVQLPRWYSNKCTVFLGYIVYIGHENKYMVLHYSSDRNPLTADEQNLIEGFGRAIKEGRFLGTHVVTLENDDPNTTRWYIDGQKFDRRRADAWAIGNAGKETYANFKSNMLAVIEGGKR